MSWQDGSNNNNTSYYYYHYGTALSRNSSRNYSVALSGGTGAREENMNASCSPASKVADGWVVVRSFLVRWWWLNFFNWKRPTNFSQLSEQKRAGRERLWCNMFACHPRRRQDVPWWFYPPYRVRGCWANALIGRYIAGSRRRRRATRSAPTNPVALMFSPS